MSSYFLFFVRKFHIEHASRQKQEVQNQINPKLTLKTKKEKKSFFKKLKSLKFSKSFSSAVNKIANKKSIQSKTRIKKAISSTFTTYI